MELFPEADPENDPISARCERALQNVAHAAISESVRGFHFDRYEDDVQMLRRLHNRVQVLKAQGSSRDADATNRARAERAQQASYVAELLVDAERQMTLPTAVKIAVEQYRAAARPHFEDTDAQSTPFEVDGVLTSSDSEGVDEVVGTETVPTMSDEGAPFRIHGLELIPPCGAPLPAMNVRKLPETLTERVKTRVDNADYWYSEHRRIAVAIAGAIAVLLLLSNLATVIYVSAYESEYIPASPATRTTDKAAPVDADDSTAGIRIDSQPTGVRSKISSVLLFLIPALIGLAGLLVFVICRSHLNKLETARRYSLRVVKSIMLPVDVSVKRSFRPVTSLSYFEEPERPSPKQPETLLERRVRAAQVIALVLLTLALLLPPFIQWTGHQLSEIRDSHEAAANVNGDASEDSATAPEVKPDVYLQDRLRSQYAWFTATVVLILFLLLLGYFMRKFHHVGRNYFHSVGFSPKRQDAPDKLPAEPKPWARDDACKEPPVDHEDPYGVMARRIADNAKGLSLAKQFRIEATIAWYRVFNKWRVLYIFAALADHALRSLGVVVFGALVLLSVVMPLVTLSIFQEGNNAPVYGLQSIVNEYFPELSEESIHETKNSAVEETVRDTLEDAAIGARLNLEVPTLDQAQAASPWAMPYVLALASIAGSNLLLLGLRFLARRRARHQVTGTNRRMTTEVAFSSLAIIAALWLWDLSPGYANVSNKHEEANSVTYRSPSIPDRVQALTEEKFFAQFFHPESTYAMVWYVDSKSAGPNYDGRTWNTAFRTIEQGILAAALGGGGEIWVGNGLYRPKSFNFRGSEYPIALVIPDNVHVYGGFAGAIAGGHESSRLERNWRANPTVLDLQTDDLPGTGPGWLRGIGRWTLDGFVVVRGRILGASGASRSGRGLLLHGVVGNVCLLLPGEPIACNLGGSGERILFHHSVLANARGTISLEYPTCMDGPGFWAVGAPQLPMSPLSQLATAKR